MTKAERLSVATHEASHYVALMRLLPDIKIKSIEIFGEPVDGFLGWVKYDASELSTTDPVNHARMVINDFAGVAGEKRLGLLSDVHLSAHARGDYDVAGDACRDWGLDGVKLMRSAETLVAEEWDVIEALATVLMERGKLTGKEAARICETAKSKTKQRTKNVDANHQRNRIKRVRRSHV